MIIMDTGILMTTMTMTMRMDTGIHMTTMTTGIPMSTRLESRVSSMGCLFRTPMMRPIP
jgi:hypothetical protein